MERSRMEIGMENNRTDDELYNQLYEIIQSAVKNEVQKTLAQQATQSGEALQEPQPVSMSAATQSGEALQEPQPVSTAAATQSAEALQPAQTGEALQAAPQPSAPESGSEKEIAYDKLFQYYTAVHQKNQKRIKAGMICLLAVPAVFLVLLLTMQSSKIIYLTLWVASLFVVCGYMIAVEYSDFSLQERMKEFGVDEADKSDELISPELAMQDIQSIKERIGL